jgi:hypothetical protein
MADAELEEVSLAPRYPAWKQSLHLFRMPPNREVYSLQRSLTSLQIRRARLAQLQQQQGGARGGGGEGASQEDQRR